ncbi:HPr family phosphocarrier protein [Mangrovihabitans endophyticus]|uniref:Phosphotransferase n=1 Tax=Mangrovihabitans endophyticus TaxID=1751298 RepID=A0A8J3FP94_9ACTN|nr:HPr family phosphocarrier protein [Mangrovihabitans endophyticus]GGK97807.1 phosphotransferase [Mangrovihabitans endophyticus]
MMRTVALGTSTGLHMRAAATIARAAAVLGVPVTVRVPGRPPVPADSLLALLTLGAGRGTELVLEAFGEGAPSALDRLADLLERDLDAEGAHG